MDRKELRNAMRMGPLPAWVKPAVIVLVVLSFVPLALISRARATKSPQTRMQIVPDMDQQPYFRSQTENRLFADRRAMRPAVAGTVPYGRADLDTGFHRGRDGEDWIVAFPVPVTSDLMRRGQERYGVYCAPCHGLSGDGDGIIHERAERLMEGTWTPPSSLHTDLVVSRPAGHIFNTITHGIRNMPAHGPQIPVGDRWAIVAYVRALQRSRSASIDDVPVELRGSLR